MRSHPLLPETLPGARRAHLSPFMMEEPTVSQIHNRLCKLRYLGRRNYKIVEDYTKALFN